MRVKTHHAIPGAVEPGDGTLHLAKVRQYKMEATFFRARVICQSPSKEALRGMIEAVALRDPGSWAVITEGEL